MHGLRFITIFCVVFGHRLVFGFNAPKYDVQHTEELYKKVATQILLNGSTVVELFFVMSGFLTGYLILSSLKEGKNFSFFRYVAHRLVRLWPTYLFTIAFYATVFTRVDNGPLWNKKVIKKANTCARNWWLNALFLNNYFDVENMCLEHSWFLACDFHLYLISPLVVLSLWKWPRNGKIFTGCLLAASIIVTFVVTYAGDLDVTVMPYFSNMKAILSDPTMKDSYIKTHARASTFLVGVISGYLAQSINWEKVKISKMTGALIQTGAFVMIIGILLSGYIFFQENDPCSTLLRATYAALFRVCLSIPVVALLLTMHAYKFPFIYRILTWKAFTPFSRLSYCIYLTHTINVTHELGSQRTIADYRSLNIFKWTINDFILTLILAFILNVMIESPVMELEKRFFRKRIVKEEPQVATTNGKSLEINNKSKTNGDVITDK